MTGQRIGYIRVSAIDQNTESQKAILAKLGIDKYFEEKVSGKNTTDRRELQNMLNYARQGDTICVKDLSRLARNTKDLLDIVEYLTNKGVTLYSDKEKIDTSTNFGKLMLTFLGAIYEFERAIFWNASATELQLRKNKASIRGESKYQNLQTSKRFIKNGLTVRLHQYLLFVS